MAFFATTIFVNTGIGNEVFGHFKCCFFQPRLFDEPLSIQISMGELLHYVIVHFFHISLFPPIQLMLSNLIVTPEIKARVNVTRVNQARNLNTSYMSRVSDNSVFSYFVISLLRIVCFQYLCIDSNILINL